VVAAACALVVARADAASPSSSAPVDTPAASPLVVDAPAASPLVVDAPAASPVPAVLARSTANLLLDLRKIVELQESTGWKIDRYEFEAMMPNALMSVCRASVGVRSAALFEAREAVVHLGGPLEEAIARRGGAADGLDTLLFASRVDALLARAIERAPSECPPWIAAAPTFDALQSPVDRWLLVAEGGGQGTVQVELDRPDGTSGATLGGGGGGRLLVGRAFGETWSLRFGPDLSAKALVKRSGESTTLPLQFQVGLPVVLRRTSVSWFSSAEIAPLALVVEDDPRVRAGVRAGVMVGRSALRVRSLVPWAGIGVEVEAFPSPDERPTLLNVKGGLRAGIDWLL
jgi:hypothetical protein